MKATSRLAHHTVASFAEMSNFDQMDEQYGTDARILPEYIKDGPRSVRQEQTEAGPFDVLGELAIKSRTTILQARAADNEANMTVDGVERHHQAVPSANNRRDARPQ